MSEVDRLIQVVDRQTAAVLSCPNVDLHEVLLDAMVSAQQSLRERIELLLGDNYRLAGGCMFLSSSPT